MKSVLEAMKPAAIPAIAAQRSALADYVELAKPEVTGLILAAAAIGFCAATPGPVRLGLLLHTLVGTLLVAAGTAALNQYCERDVDGLMRRTASRPLPAGRLSPGRALTFGAATVIGGVAYLAATCNLLAALLALLTTGAYLLIYTPLKRKTPICTTLGAFPGAAPPLIGWAAATGGLGAGAWVLFAILFFWQFPHFLAIAWMYREDYARAGIRMLPVVEPQGTRTARQVLFCSGALLPVSVVPGVLGIAGLLYVAGATLAGLAFFYCSVRLANRRSMLEARRLLHASVAYLPLLYGILLVDHAGWIR